MFDKDRAAEEQKAFSVSRFLESEIIRLEGVIRHCREEIKIQGEDFNMDNPNGGMYSGMELTAVHHEMEKMMQYANEAANDIFFYKKLRNEPYFARVDLKAKGALAPRTIYIGLRALQDPETFELYVCDWRSPIASLFYEDFEDEAFFESPKGRMYCDLLLKRQYKFENGKLKYYVDSDLKINDEILKNVLSSKSGEQLKVIVNSIQKEQNKAIRFNKDKNLFIDGPAGSGKTSVGFHRLAYLLYRNRLELASSEIVMFSNNNIFTSYVADIIPELGETPISYSSFYNIFEAEIPYMGAEDYYSLAEAVMQKDDLRIKSARMKLSREFAAYLEKSVYEIKPVFKDVIFKYENPETFMPETEVIISGEELTRRFMEDTLYNYRLRGERLSAFGQSMLETFFAQEDTRQKLMYETKATIKRQLRQTKEAFVNNVREAVNFNPLRDYFRILGDFANEKGCPEITRTKDSLSQGYLEFEDALCIVYMKTVLGTAAVLSGVKHVLIDEVQDLSFFQHKIIRAMFPGAVVTLLGDTNQAILPLINTTDTSLLEEIYGAETLRLNKSYRSTKEINEFALSLLPEERRYEIFRRDGEKVDFTEGDLTELSELVKLSTQDDTGVCIITSTIEGARRLHHRLFPLNNEIKLCDTSKGQLSHKPFIMPLVLTKGLEFDRVIVYNDGGFEGEENKSNLYMASTRALHKLTIFNEKD